MKKIILIGVLIGILLIAGCGNGQNTGITGAVTLDINDGQGIKTNEPEAASETPECPDCDDNNQCTQDICNEGTGYECAYRIITPCCGNNECESDENSAICPEDCKKSAMSEKLQKAISGQQKIKSYKYTLYGNKVADRIYVKGNKMRYDLSKNKQRDFAPMSKYDAVYLDKTKKEAYLSCIDVSCENRYESDKADYNEFIMETPIEMIYGIKYTSDIIGTEICDSSKPCNKVKVMFDDGKTGLVWIDNYYGFPYKIEKSGKLYEFVAVAVNAVKDSDVELP